MLTTLLIALSNTNCPNVKTAFQSCCAVKDTPAYDSLSVSCSSLSCVDPTVAFPLFQALDHFNASTDLGGNEILVVRGWEVDTTATYPSTSLPGYCTNLQNFGFTLSSTCTNWCANTIHPSSSDEINILDCLSQTVQTSATTTTSAAPSAGVTQITYHPTSKILYQATAFTSISAFNTDYGNRVYFHSFGTGAHYDIYNARKLLSVTVVTKNSTALAAYATHPDAIGKSDLDLGAINLWIDL